MPETLSGATVWTRHGRPSRIWMPISIPSSGRRVCEYMRWLGLNERLISNNRFRPISVVHIIRQEWQLRAHSCHSTPSVSSSLRAHFRPFGRKFIKAAGPLRHVIAPLDRYDQAFSEDPVSSRLVASVTGTGGAPPPPIALTEPPHQASISPKCSSAYGLQFVRWSRKKP